MKIGFDGRKISTLDHCYICYVSLYIVMDIV